MSFYEMTVTIFGNFSDPFLWKLSEHRGENVLDLWLPGCVLWLKTH